ncbi:MAG: DNA methyltransferase [Fervidicoccaceae archaeon]
MVESELQAEGLQREILKLHEGMKEIKHEDFLLFKSTRKSINIGGKELSLRVPKPKVLEPESFEAERTTVWSFPQRGKWATHKHNASYRGNWAPQVARNLILLYSEEGETVLDPFMGSGTTIIECILLKRKCIGIDINEDSVMLAWSRIEPILNESSRVKLYRGDARNLDLIDDESVELVAGHPPYAGIIKYSSDSSNGEGDLSRMKLEEYLRAMGEVAREIYRILKTGKVAAIMVGDARKKKHIIPLGYMVMLQFLRAGFTLKEHIIKVQHNMIGTIPWMKRNKDFLLLKHEHIFVFEKTSEELTYSKELPLLISNVIA